MSKQSKLPLKRLQPQRVAQKVIEEIVILSSDDEDVVPRPAKCKPKAGCKHKTEISLAPKEVEGKLLAEDNDEAGPVVQSIVLSRSKSPSLLKGQLFQLVKSQSVEEAEPPLSGNEPRNGKGGGEGVKASSPIATLESHLEDEVEPIISLGMVQEDMDEDEVKTDPLADTAYDIEDKAVKNTFGTIVPAETADTDTNETEIPGIGTSSSKVITSDAVPCSSRSISSKITPLPIDENKTEGKEETSGTSRPECELKKFLEEFGKKITPNELKIIEGKMWKAFGKIKVNSCSATFQKKIGDQISDFTLSLETLKKWKVAHALQTFLDSVDGGEKKQKKKQVLIAKLEAKLKMLARLIEEYDQKDVESDDEVNSSYMIKSRLVKQFMDNYQLLCKIHKSDTFTDRPTQKKIKTKGLIGYDEISDAVDNYVNGQGSLTTPDFPEILKIAKSVCARHRICIDDEEIHESAKKLFEFIVKTIKKRRILDLDDVLPKNPRVIDDPADKDAELEAKLRENETQKRAESEVLKEYVERQTAMQEEAKEVDEEEDIENSPEASDDEDEEEDSLEDEVSRNPVDLEGLEMEDEDLGGSELSSPTEIALSSENSNGSVDDDGGDQSNGKQSTFASAGSSRQKQ